MEIKKTVNVSTVNYAILNEHGQMINRKLIIPRKLSPAAALREAKKREADKSVIQLTVKVETVKKTYSMSFDDFIDHATEN